MGQWINKMWSICTTEYYLSLKGKEILTRATTWMNLNVMLSEISQSQRHIQCDSCYEVPQVTKFMETESRMLVARSQGMGK